MKNSISAKQMEHLRGCLPPMSQVVGSYIRLTLPSEPQVTPNTGQTPCRETAQTIEFRKSIDGWVAA